MSGSLFLFAKNTRNIMIEQIGVLTTRRLVGTLFVFILVRGRKDNMPKKKINRLNKPYYVSDEYGHSDKILVQKVNELIGVVNRQQEIINDFERIMKNRR